MEEGDGKDSDLSQANGGGGDASDLLPLRGADSSPSLASKPGDSEGNRTSSAKSAAHSENSLAPSESKGMFEGSLAGVDNTDVVGESTEPSVHQKNADSFSPSQRKQHTATQNHRLTEGGQRLTNDSGKTTSDGQGDDEQMCVDSEDAVLGLDQSVEKDSAVNVAPRRVQLATVLSAVESSATKEPSANTESNGQGSENCKDDVSAAKGDEPSAHTSSTAVNGHDHAASGSAQDDGKAVAPNDLPDTLSDSDDMSDSDDDEGEGAGVVNSRLLSARQKGILRRRRLFTRRFGRLNQLSSSSDSLDDLNSDGNEGGGGDNNDQTAKESDNDEEIQRVVQGVLDKPMPRPSWFALQELRKREYCNTGRHGSSWFREGVQSSLQMVRRLVVVDQMHGHEGCVNALSFNRIGTLLASGSDDLDIVLWNWQKRRPSVTYESGHRSNVFQAKFMPFSGDCHVISCARDGQVRLAELNSWGVCKATRRLAQHRGAAHKLALELDSPHVFLSCGEDALTYLFDLRQEKPHKLVTAKENEKKVPLYSIHSNPCDSHQFCVGGRDHYIRVYDKRKISEQTDGGVLKKFCPDHLVSSDLKVNVTCACYSYNGSEILGTYNDEDIYLFDNAMSDGANYIHKYAGHRNSATAKGVNFYGPKSQFIVSGSDCGHVYFWDKETEAIINFQKGDDTGVINVLEPHPTLPVLATSGLDHDVKLWMPMLMEPHIDGDTLKKTMKKNQVERHLERCTSEPEIGGQMLWFIMNHFRNSARRRMREEGQELSTSDEDDDDSNSDDSETNQMRCAQS